VSDDRHAGNYCITDLQQYATSLVPPAHLALTVLATVLSLYPHRDEALCDAGGLAVSKDTGPIAGFGDVISANAYGWRLGKVSQEHGILVRRRPDDRGLQLEVVDPIHELTVGDRIRLVPQHACLVLAAQPWVYIVDGGDEVVDVWVPWKGW
jgi:D-serine deaminase-like pyridoxal phosphate-dependent protein